MIVKLFKVFLTLTGLAAVSFMLSAQDTVIRGRVVDSSGEVVIGAAIVLDGTTIGTVTDMDGQFSLKSPNIAGTLTVSSIGYSTQKVSFRGSRELSIVLQDDAELLEEVVVIGYGTIKKKDLTGAVASVGSREFESSAMST